MIDLLIALLVAVIVGGILYYIITLIPLPHPFKPIALAILGLIILLILLSYLLPMLRVGARL